jgi:dTDP-4-amino-4,6-dideoxygalactose transaminase
LRIKIKNEKGGLNFMLKQQQERLEMLKTALESGVWGTIGPTSLSAADAVAKRLSVKYGVLMHSAAAALETQLRALEIGYGDEVIVASYADPMDSMTAATVGATPVFADIDPSTATLCPSSVKTAVTNKTKAVIADIPGGNPCDAEALESLCKEKGIKLIINLGDGYNSAFNSKPIGQYAWGAIVNFADGYSLSAGEGGGAVHNDAAANATCHAYHNCGRAVGEGASLVIDDDMLGGNMRITEWQSVIIETGIEESDKILTARKAKAEKVLESVKFDWLTPLTIIDKGISSYHSLIYRYNKDKNNGLTVSAAIEELRKSGLKACRPWKAMHRQPAFSSPYFKKITGFNGKYSDDGLTNSIAAEEELIWVIL